jgi:hypothetical protein
MKLSKASEILGLKTIQGQYTDIDIKCAYTSDLLSDVMGNSPDEAVLITIQAHKNTVAVAVLKDSPAIIICNNRSVPEDMIISAKDENIAVFVSRENQFTVSGRLFSLLEQERL